MILHEQIGARTHLSSQIGMPNYRQPLKEVVPFCIYPGLGLASRFAARLHYNVKRTLPIWHDLFMYHLI
jgi:hypothetical protein